MAIIQITVPDTRVQDVLDAFGYQATIDGVANPETSQVFMKRKIAEYVKGKVEPYLLDKASQNVTITKITIT